ncbi:hypothetical protein [Allorhizobium borbori]|uniref:Uncharacterized protein n=1 Tax=Allorhizobium borbori TaxID=485907 RepID=A0A7W6K0K3_9HYPH|nr:hypothetical protein [Allorhizobium borbori]MBB4101915.1 hypothetical protein [Allorhizobium borbori]
MTEVAAVGCNERFVLFEARVEIGKICVVSSRVQSPGGYSVLQSFHRRSLFYVNNLMQTVARRKFLSIGKIFKNAWGRNGFAN